METSALLGGVRHSSGRSALWTRLPRFRGRTEPDLWQGALFLPQGELHTAFYLSFRAGGRAYVVELPRRFASEAKRLQRNWLRLEALLEQLALVQVRLWKEVPREGRTSVRRVHERSRMGPA